MGKVTGFLEIDRRDRRYAPAMFGPRLFRSRWAALLWAGGILWTAYDVAGGAAPPAPATPPRKRKNARRALRGGRSHSGPQRP